jgi:hypothetical protein
MRLTKSTLIHHLLDRGRISPRSCVDGEFRVAEQAERNRLFRVGLADSVGYFVKHPLTLEGSRTYTLWVEAACYWLINNDPGFSPLRRSVPEFYHYDYQKHILVLGLLPSVESLHSLYWRTRVPDQRHTDSIASLLITLHGEVSAHALSGKAVSLFSRAVPWALTIHDAGSCWFQPQTNADLSILQYVRGKPALSQTLEAVRASWAESSLIHGDIKWSNFLVDPNNGPREGSPVKLIDWEIASVGDPLWDVAGVFCSYLLFLLHADGGWGTAVGARGFDARFLVALARFWRFYCDGLAMAPGGRARALVKAVAFAGVRMIQSCIESAGFLQSFDENTHKTLRFGEDLLARPEDFAAYVG